MSARTPPPDRRSRIRPLAVLLSAVLLTGTAAGQAQESPDEAARHVRCLTASPTGSTLCMPASNSG